MEERVLLIWMQLNVEHGLLVIVFETVVTNNTVVTIVHRDYDVTPALPLSVCVPLALSLSLSFAAWYTVAMKNLAKTEGTSTACQVNL